MCGANQSARLAVTRNTVQSHLSRAHGKLGVIGRGQLLARLFRDVYWSGLPLPNAASEDYPWWIDRDSVPQ